MRKEQVNLRLIKKFDEKEVLELKKIYNHYPKKRKEIMNSNKCKVEDIFGDIISKINISQDRINELNNFSAKKM